MLASYSPEVQIQDDWLDVKRKEISSRLSFKAVFDLDQGNACTSAGLRAPGRVHLLQKSAVIFEERLISGRRISIA